MNDDRPARRPGNRPEDPPRHGDPPSDPSDHWLKRPATIWLLWGIFIGSLVLTVIPDFFIEQYEHFGIDGTFGFYAWYGFGASVALILLSRAVGSLIQRRDDYYDR